MRKLFLTCLAVSASVGAWGCSRESGSSAGKTPSKPRAPSSLTAKAPPKPKGPDRRALAEGFHRSRCALVGELKQPWLGTPWSSDSGFRAAFDAEAQADPVWAEQVVAESYARPCKPTVDHGGKGRAAGEDGQR